WGRLRPWADQPSIITPCVVPGERGPGRHHPPSPIRSQTSCRGDRPRRGNCGPPDRAYGGMFATCRPIGRHAGGDLMTAPGDTAGKGLRSTWTRVNGRMMYARVSEAAAPADRPTVVLVHGLGVSGTYMVPTAQRLAVDHAVYVPDLPGYG